MIRRNLPAYLGLIVCTLLLVRQNGCALPVLPVVAPIKAEGLHVLMLEETENAANYRPINA